MEKKLDLLLVNVGGTKKRVYQELSKDYSAIEPPFWAALTAGFIRKNGFLVNILDANAENLDIKESAEKIEELNPKLVCVVVYGQHPSASTQLMSSAGLLCKEIKKNNFERKIILIGLHPSALAEKTLKEEDCDFVCEGEGFYTLLGLLENKKLEEIPGLWYKEDSKIFHTERAELIKDLTSELSEVAWDLLPMDKYKAHNWHCLSDLESRNRYASISTSLGCPFNCSFCCINAPFGKHIWRTWKPEWVLKQIDILVKDYNVKNIKFIDELFVLKPEHFIPIAEGLIKRNYNLNIWAYARVDTTKEEYLELLKKAGINWLALGFEAGNEEVMKEASKSQFTKKQVIETRERIKKYGINVIGNFIFGLPEDNLKSMEETLDLAMELNCEWVNIYCATAYPGSKLYDYAIANNLPLPDSWEKYAQHHYEFLPLPTKYTSAEEVLRFRDNAFMKYFTNPEYLKIIKEKFGEKALEHVKNMCEIKLKRKLLGD
jgi:anaerobic magnesium-protoporphyrin IX monomethyl ester cyclase